MGILEIEGYAARPQRGSFGGKMLNFNRLWSVSFHHSEKLGNLKCLIHARSGQLRSVNERGKSQT
jgi:hypothetical protein